MQGTDPGSAELQALLDGSLRKGAIGLKLLGGHYPLTPEATARTIALANARHAYVALQAGRWVLVIDGQVQSTDEISPLMNSAFCCSVTTS